MSGYENCIQEYIDYFKFIKKYLSTLHKLLNVFINISAKTLDSNWHVKTDLSLKIVAHWDFILFILKNKCKIFALDYITIGIERLKMNDW